MDTVLTTPAGYIVDIRECGGHDRYGVLRHGGKFTVYVDEIDHKTTEEIEAEISHQLENHASGYILADEIPF